MKRMNQTASFPQYDYGAALKGALNWLGDRYLLAEPTPRLAVAPNPYFVEQRRWHPAVVAGALAKTSR